MLRPPDVNVNGIYNGIVKNPSALVLLTSRIWRFFVL